MDELEMRKAEVEALRGYYQKTKQAVAELESTLKLIRSKPYLSEREHKALDELLGEQK